MNNDDIFKFKTICVPALPPGQMKDTEIELQDVKGNPHKMHVVFGCKLPPGLIGKKETPIEEPIEEPVKPPLEEELAR